MTTYVCINKLESLWATPQYILINVKGRRYHIIRRNDEFYIDTPEGKQIKLINFSVDENVAVVWAYEELYSWSICEKVETSNEN